MAAGGKKTTLQILECKPVFHGVNGKGDNYTIHEIRAAKPDGTVVNEKLRSFTALPVGQTITVTVTPYDSDKYGRSFTLYPEDKGVGTTAQQNSLAEQVEAQREMIANLANRMTDLEHALRELRTGGNSQPTAVQGQTPDQVAALDAQFGGDPPFA